MRFKISRKFASICFFLSIFIVVSQARPLAAQAVRVFTQYPGPQSEDELYEQRIQEFFKSYQQFRQKQDRQFDNFFEEEFFGSPTQALKRIEEMQKRFSALLLESQRAGLIPQAQSIYKISQEETGGKLIYRIDVPDLEKKNFKIEVKDGLLRISEESRQLAQSAGPAGQWKTQSSFLGHFQKIIPLPEGVDPQSVEYKKEQDQILVIIPKGS
jgi:Molecular chaperone (small heat shock protein)